MIEQKSAFYISQKLITLKAKEICITIRKGRKEVIIVLLAWPLKSRQIFIKVAQK